MRSFIAGFIAAAAVIAPIGAELGETPINMAAAAETNVDSDAKQRVYLAARQRMLSQRMTKAACMLSIGADHDRYLAVMSEAETTFDETLRALRDGETRLGVDGAERSSKVVRALAVVEGEWTLYKGALDAMIERDEFSGPDLETVFAHNLPLLDASETALAMVKKAHANPNDMLMSTAIAINIADRQRMLSQEIAAVLCELDVGWRPAETKAKLAEVVSLFETSHKALAEGLPAAGIAPPPTEEARRALDKVWAHWLTMRDDVEAALAGALPSAASLSAWGYENDLLLEELDEVVALYSGRSASGS
ncbi:MAG: type IV pili methyl-accepting chemotaxis transducer N-terminal domain-containing protein [Pseudomonadota bacterium]